MNQETPPRARGWQPEKQHRLRACATKRAWIFRRAQRSDRSVKNNGRFRHVGQKLQTFGVRRCCATNCKVPMIRLRMARQKEKAPIARGLFCELLIGGC